MYIAISERGRVCGESHPNARFSDHDIDLVFALSESGMPQVLIAEKMEMSRSYVCMLLKYTRRVTTPKIWRFRPSERAK